jgi:hypothetical protein
MINFKVLTVLALALTCAPAMAQTALQDLGAASGADMAPIMSAMKLTRDMSAAQGPLTIPRFPKDVLEKCDALEAKPFVAWNVKQASLMIQTCLNHTYTTDGAAYKVEARAGRFAVKACPGTTDAASCRAIIEVEGIVIAVSGRIMTGNAVLSDLNYSINKRGGKLLGFYATLDDKAVIVH